MEQANVVPRINPLILSSERRYLDFTASPSNAIFISDVVMVTSLPQITSFLMEHFDYLFYFCTNSCG